MSVTTNVPALVVHKAASSLALMRSVVDWRAAVRGELSGNIVGMRPRIGPFGEGRQLLVRTAEEKIFAVWVTPWIGDQLAIIEEMQREAKLADEIFDAAAKEQIKAPAKPLKGRPPATPAVLRHPCGQAGRTEFGGVIIRNAEQSAAHGTPGDARRKYYCQACGRAIASIVFKVCGFWEAAQKK